MLGGVRCKRGKGGWKGVGRKYRGEGLREWKRYIETGERYSEGGEG